MDSAGLNRNEKRHERFHDVCFAMPPSTCTLISAVVFHHSSVEGERQTFQEGTKLWHLIIKVSKMNLDQAVGFRDNNEVGPPISENNTAAEKVFSNDVIWRTLGSYLNLGDLKACRLVSSGFHGMIMKETNFLQRCLVSLKPDQITKNIFGSTSDELWKNVVLTFQSPIGGSYCYFSYEDLKNLDWLYPVIENVESLSLRMKKGTKGGHLFPLLKQLLLATKKLRSLAMEPIFLFCGTSGNCEELKEILGKLEELEILQPSPEWLFDIDGWVDIDPWLVSTDFVKQLQNLRVVKSYYLQRCVQVTPGGPSSAALFLECEVLTSVLTRIAHHNNKTLKHVTLGESRLWYQDGLFPSLPFLPKKSQPGAVIKYFEAMPMLQELDFTNRLSTFPMEILNVIEDKKDSLRQVKLESLTFSETKWEFLEQTKLEEFHMGMLDSLCGSPRRLPTEAQGHLPLTIRRLFLRGTLESNPVPALTRLNPTLVTELTFIDSGNCFGDDAIKYVRENFVMLRKLNVTKAERVTDAGFIGSSTGPGSLSRIKGLRTLILRECGSITDATLREIRFLELCYLDLAYNEKLTEGGFEEVLKNNSSLETLLTSCKNVYRKREQLCASHPRLSSVIYRGLKTKKKAC